MGGSRDRLNPKVRQKRGSYHYRTSRLKQMAMLLLSHAILSTSARTGEPSESPCSARKRVNPKHMNRLGELGVHHDRKSLIYRENLATRSHEIKRSIARVIDKYNIVAMALLRSKGNQTSYMRMDQINRMLRHRGTSRIG
jgi:hypothetical protein